jgi:hypothetical protein
MSNKNPKLTESVGIPYPEVTCIKVAWGMYPGLGSDHNGDRSRDQLSRNAYNKSAAWYGRVDSQPFADADHRTMVYQVRTGTSIRILGKLIIFRLRRSTQLSPTSTVPQELARFLVDYSVSLSRPCRRARRLAVGALCSSHSAL